jgi:hypothetical protein
MTTATAVPRTRGALEGDEGARDPQADWSAAPGDGFVHPLPGGRRLQPLAALAFQITLTLLPALIAVLGLAAALRQDDFSRMGPADSHWLSEEAAHCNRDRPAESAA